MYVYIYVLLISLLFASLLMELQKLPIDVLQYKTTEVKKQYAEYTLLFISMAPFIILCGLRYEVGADYSFTYTKIYDLVSQGLSLARVNNNVNCEIGFYILNKIIVALGGGYVWIFTVSSAIIIALFWIGFYQQSDNLCLSIILFFCCETFFISLCYVRQFMALSIVFWGLKYLKTDSKKDILKFAICVLIACLFHTSAIVMLVWVALRFIKIRPEILVAVIAVFSALKDKFEIILIKILEYTPYANYLGSVYQSRSRFYSTRPIAFIAVFAIAVLFYKKCHDDKKYFLMLNTTAFLIFITVNFDLMPQLDRVTWYFETITILFVPYLLSKMEKPWIKKVITVAVITMFAIFVYDNVVVYRAHGVIPYRLVFSPNMIFR